MERRALEAPARAASAAGGDVIVFIFPREREKHFLKRVVAVGGQTIEIRDRVVYVDGQPWDDPHARYTAEGSGMAYGPFTVPADALFVLGDNRDRSYDSRFWGPVPVADVIGRAVLVYWSWDGPSWRVRWPRVGLPVRSRTRRASG